MRENEKQRNCLLCDCKAIEHDEWCEEHLRCFYCGDREECVCIENEKIINQYNRNRPFIEYIDNINDIKK